MHLFEQNRKLLSLLYVILVIVLYELILSDIPYARSSATTVNGGSENSNPTGADMNSVMLQYIVPATVAAVASVTAAIVAAWNQSKLKKLEEVTAEQNARRDYEYEARKRLYHDLEPLVFLHVEDSDNAYGSYNRTCQYGKIRDLGCKPRVFHRQD